VLCDKLVKLKDIVSGHHMRSRHPDYWPDGTLAVIDTAIEEEMDSCG